MSVPKGYEAVYNSWRPIAWLVSAPAFAIIGGTFFEIPVLALAGGVGLMLEALYLIVFNRGLAAAADITARQAGVSLAAIALAAIGYGLTLVAQDERWMWLVAALVVPILGVISLTLQGRAGKPILKRRWIDVIGFLWVIAIVLYVAAGGAT